MAPRAYPVPTCHEEDFLLLADARTCPFSPRDPGAGQVGTEGRRRRGVLQTLKYSCMPVPHRDPYLAVATVLGKTSEELPEGAPKARARAQTWRDLEAPNRQAEPAPTETSTPVPAPAPARIPAGPVRSLPAGARVGLGCAFLRAFFPGISGGNSAADPGETQSPNLESAGGELRAGRLGGTGMEKRLSARPRTSQVLEWLRTRKPELLSPGTPRVTNRNLTPSPPLSPPLGPLRSEERAQRFGRVGELRAASRDLLRHVPGPRPQHRALAG